ncbi:MAG: cbb3-type cytochrome oxidase subunit 3 [Geminicoccaceae bacterium]
MDLATISELARQLWVVWLMIIFLGIVAYAYWPRNKKKFEDAARIPFDDDDDDAKPEA